MLSAKADAVTDLQRFGVKFFLRNPAGVRLEDFVPVFHRWIREQAADGTLVDVASYAHVTGGPGVVLVGHEADIALDSSEGPLGLLYLRKRASEVPPARRFGDAFRAALAACARLEAEPAFGGSLRFEGGRALFIANDRLLAPNTGEAFALLRPDLEAALLEVYGGGKVELSHDLADPRRRLTVRIETSAS